MNQTQASGMMSDRTRVDQGSNLTYDHRKLWDGTSEREINKALSTFLNNTGPGDYNLPNLVGNNSVISGMTNKPQWSLRKKSKPGYFPHYRTELAGQSSPAASKYSPKQDKDYPNLQYSSPRFSRFYKEPSTESNFVAKVPV